MGNAKNRFIRKYKRGKQQFVLSENAKLLNICFQSSSRYYTNFLPYVLTSFQGRFYFSFFCRGINEVLSNVASHTGCCEARSVNGSPKLQVSHVTDYKPQLNFFELFFLWPSFGSIDFDSPLGGKEWWKRICMLSSKIQELLLENSQGHVSYCF